MKLYIPLLIALLFSSVHAASTVEEVKIDRFRYQDILDVKQFWLIDVTLDGTAEKIGLSREELRDFLRLRYANLFTGFPLKEMPRDEKGYPSADIVEREWALLSVTIWTVGTEYPVAYHMELKITKFRGGMYGYHDAALGYASAKDIVNGRIVRDALSSMMERAAATLLKIQGKM